MKPDQKPDQLWLLVTGNGTYEFYTRQSAAEKCRRFTDTMWMANIDWQQVPA